MEDDGQRLGEQQHWHLVRGEQRESISSGGLAEVGDGFL